MIIFASLIFSLLVPFAIGYILITALTIKEEPFVRLEKFSLSYGLGVGFLTLQMLLISMLGLSLNKINILTACVLVWTMPLVYILIKRKRSRQVFELKDKTINKTPAVYVFAIITAFVLIYAIVTALAYPLCGGDGLVNWGLKAKIFFLRNTISLRNAYGSYNSGWPEYPLLIPLFGTWIYLVLGGVKEALAQIAFPLFGVSLATLFYYLQRRSRISALQAVLFTAFLFTTSRFLIVHLTIFHADFALTFFYTIATLYLYAWMSSADKKNHYLILAGLFSGISMWTKTEGFFLILINAVVFILYSIHNRRILSKKMIRYFFVFLIPVLFFVIPWSLFRVVNNLDFIPGGHMNTAVNAKICSIIRNFGDMPIIFREVIKLAVNPIRCGIFWLLFLLVLIFRAKKILKPPCVWLFVIILLNLGFIISAYFMTLHPLIAQINCTWDRLTMHFLPVAVFLISLAIKEDFESITKKRGIFG